MQSALDATIQGDVATIEELRKEECRIETVQTMNKVNLAYVAVQNGHTDMLKKLFRWYGADFIRGTPFENERSNLGNGRTIAHCAVERGDPGLILLLGQMVGGVFMCKGDARDSKPGHLIIKLLNDNQAIQCMHALHSIDPRTLMGDRGAPMLSPILDCAWYGRDALFREYHLLKYDLFDVESDGRNAAHLACQRQKLNILHTLVLLGGERLFKRTNNIGQYPIHAAAEAGNTEICRFIALIAGSNAYLKRCHHHWNIAHYAASSGRLNILQMLVQRGYNLLFIQKDIDGKTPIEVLQPNAAPAIKEFMEAIKQDGVPRVYDSQFHSWQHRACVAAREGRVDTLEDMHKQVGTVFISPNLPTHVPNFKSSASLSVQR